VGKRGTISHQRFEGSPLRIRSFAKRAKASLGSNEVVLGSPPLELALRQYHGRARDPLRAGDPFVVPGSVRGRLQRASSLLERALSMYRVVPRFEPRKPGLELNCFGARGGLVCQSRRRGKCKACPH